MNFLVEGMAIGLVPKELYMAEKYVLWSNVTLLHGYINAQLMQFIYESPLA